MVACWCGTWSSPTRAVPEGQVVILHTRHWPSLTSPKLSDTVLGYWTSAQRGGYCPPPDTKAMGPVGSKRRVMDKYLYLSGPPLPGPAPPSPTSHPLGYSNPWLHIPGAATEADAGTRVLDNRPGPDFDIPHPDRPDLRAVPNVLQRVRVSQRVDAVSRSDPKRWRPTCKTSCRRRPRQSRSLTMGSSFWESASLSRSFGLMPGGTRPGSRDSRPMIIWCGLRL